ncbi:MAG: PorT family protein [Chitinophagaceae bacterium]|nr:PorT family protein [Chitinophagaceae bacterium]
MKKLFALALSILCISFSSFSQTTIKPTIGLNITDFSKSDDGTAKGKVGYQFGGSIAFGKKFYIEPGVFYVGKSTAFTISNQTNNEFKADIKGVRVPVALGLNVLGNEKSFISVRGFGGVSGFFVTSVGDDVDKSELNSTNWGLFAGAGVDLFKFFVDMSYEWSLTDIQKDVSAINIGKSRTFYISAGLRINL